MQLDKARQFSGCLAQSHLQLDTLNFDLYNFQAMIAASDLSFLGAHTVLYFTFECFTLFALCFECAISKEPLDGDGTGERSC